jgi:hypothetical protein
VGPDESGQRTGRNDLRGSAPEAACAPRRRRLSSVKLSGWLLREFTSSLSGITSRAPCYPAFSQLVRFRKYRRDEVNGDSPALLTRRL